MPAIRTRKSSISSKVTLYESNPQSSPPPPPPLRRSTRSQTLVSTPFKAESPEPSPPPTTKKKKQTSSSPTKKAAPLSTPHPPPKNWERQYEIIRNQRETIVAPVDLMGCEQGGIDTTTSKPVEQSWKDKKLSTLVSLMLSSQTKDPVTHLATQNLRNHLSVPGLSLESLLSATVEQIDECIKKVGFHSTKAHNLKLMAERVRDEFDGEVPEVLEDLLGFRGVGPKMAFIAMSSYGHNIGIGVDTHVHRITHRLRWHKKEPKNAEETRVNLESWLPKERWPLVNKMLVGFGQSVCKPVGPRCDLCDLGRAKLCPSRRIVPTTSPRKKKESIKVEEREVKVEGEEREGEGEGDEGKPKLEIGFEVQEETIVDVREGDGQLVVKEEEEETIKIEIV